MNITRKEAAGFTFRVTRNAFALLGVYFTGLTIAIVCFHW